MNRESIRYLRGLRRIGDKAQRPFSSFKSGDKSSTSLNIKSKTINLEKITMSKNGLNFGKTFKNNINNIEFNEYIVLDLSKSNIHNITLTNHLFISNIINYEEGITYYLIINQDSTGGHQIAWGDNINIKFDDGIINNVANSETMIKITPLNGVLYAEIISNYSNLSTDSLSFTIDTTLGSNAGPSYKLQTKPDYVSITKGEQYSFNYDFIVDWGDGTSDHITSAEQPENNHTYSTDGQYTITITGLCEAFGFLYLDIKDMVNGYINFDDLLNYMSSIHFEKITTVESLGNIGLKDASYMFGIFAITPMNITSIDGTNWDVGSVTNMQGMFSFCSSLTDLSPLSNWDVSNVTDMDSMFTECLSLTDLSALSNWNASNVTDMGNMFRGCTSLTNIDLSNWDVSNVTDMRYMFTDVPLDTPSYDALLIGWSSLSPNLQNNVEFSANLAQYTLGGAAEAGRDILTTTHSWNIDDAGPIV